MRIPVKELPEQYVRWTLEYFEENNILANSEIEAQIYHDRYNYVSFTYKKNEIARMYNKKYPFFDNYVMIASRNHLVKIKTYRNVISDERVSEHIGTLTGTVYRKKYYKKHALNKKEFKKFIGDISLSIELVDFITMLNDSVMNIKRENRSETVYEVEDYDKETQQ